MLVAAASYSPYLKIQVSTGPNINLSGMNLSNFGGADSQGSTWIYYMLWNNLETPTDSDGPQVYSLEGEPFDPGFSGTDGGPQTPVIYSTQGQTSPWTPS